jgi:hypothetical protein
MREYLQDRVVKIGLMILALGSGPLLAIIFLAKVGIWPDPNPNPIGPGLLMFLTFWPGVITLLSGLLGVKARLRKAPRPEFF